MKRVFFGILLIGITNSTTHSQTVIVNETFNYASEAALHAVWSGFVGTTTGYPVFDPPATPAQVEERFELVSVSAASADFNGNTVVDAADYPLWRKNNGKIGGATQAQGDANGDGNVDNADYLAWRAAFGTPPAGGGSDKFVRHLANAALTANRSPDGNLVYQPPLDPNSAPAFSIFPGDGLEPIVLRGDIYVESPALQRNTIGLRSFFEGSSANLFEMGVYNDAANSTPVDGSAMVPAIPDCAANPSQACAGFGVRVQLFTINPGPNPNWQFFAFDPLWDTDGNGLVTQTEVIAAVGPGWHRFEATISEDPDTTGHDITVTVDLLRDGKNNAQNSAGVDATLVMNDFVEVTPAGFNSLRLGGPSSLPSTGEVSYDNIFLSGPQIALQGSAANSAVPEPATAVLALCASAVITLLTGTRSRRDVC